MIKKTKGFTLIELLAVIVILAVIALIATPIIMNVINDSKKGAAKDSMYSYVKAVEMATAKDLKPDTDLLSGTYIIKDGNLYNASNKILDIDLKGTKPENQKGFIVLTKGQVKSAELKFDGYCIQYDGEKAINNGDCDESIPSNTYAVGAEVYFDPTGSVTDCASGKEWTSSKTGTTCYKWNVIKDNGSTVDVLLNHNIGNQVAWNFSDSNLNGPKEVYDNLKTSTSSWTKVSTLTNSDNVTRKNGIGGTYTINYNGMKARLISGQEVADIVKNSSWTPSSSSAITLSTASWLYENTSSANTATAQYGYWTDTSLEMGAPFAWFITYDAELYSGRVGVNIHMGTRPVVRISKDNL